MQVHDNLIMLDDMPAGFLVATLPQGNHKLLATFGGNEDLEPSSSLPLNVAAGGVRVRPCILHEGDAPSFRVVTLLQVCTQASLAKDDVPVPAPFPDSAASEDALGIRFVSASSSGAQYQSIEQVRLQCTC